MSRASSIQGLKPRLQPIFGLLSSSEDSEIREIFDEVDRTLLDFADTIGSKRVEWEGTGLEYIWTPSGQIEISSFVSAGIDGSHMVSFILSLQPSWYYDGFPAEPQWTITASIEADCQHTVDCGYMHCVHKMRSVIARRPIDAAKDLWRIAGELAKLGQEKPLSHWLALAGRAS